MHFYNVGDKVVILEATHGWGGVRKYAVAEVQQVNDRTDKGREYGLELNAPSYGGGWSCIFTDIVPYVEGRSNSEYVQDRERLIEEFQEYNKVAKELKEQAKLNNIKEKGITTVTVIIQHRSLVDRYCNTRVDVDLGSDLLQHLSSLSDLREFVKSKHSEMVDSHVHKSRVYATVYEIGGIDFSQSFEIEEEKTRTRSKNPFARLATVGELF